MYYFAKQTCLPFSEETLSGLRSLSGTLGEGGRAVVAGDTEQIQKGIWRELA